MRKHRNQSRRRSGSLLAMIVLCGAAGWSQDWVEYGELRISGKQGFPHWTRTVREYANFGLRFDHRLDLARSNIEAGYENRWFLLQVRVEGPRCLVRLDGRTVAGSASLPETLPRRGRIGLQMHSDVGSIEFRDLRVRRLGDATTVEVSK